jgi:hypothetical protein
MKLKKLRKKIRQLENRLQEDSKKLARLKQRLATAETAKASKVARKSAALTTPAQPSAGAKKPVTGKKAKRKLNLSPERRAQLSDAMKARWAAKRAAEASPNTAWEDQDSVPTPTPQAPETKPDGA